MLWRVAQEHAPDDVERQTLIVTYAVIARDTPTALLRRIQRGSSK